MIDGQIILHPNWHTHPKADEIREKVRQCLPYFPEIKHVEIKAIGQRGSGAIANWNHITQTLGVNIAYFPSTNTFFHEFGHGLQSWENGSVIPRGEEAATIYGLARMPPELTESTYLPYLGLAPRDQIQKLCMAAIKRRDDGCRTYIKWFRGYLEHLKACYPLAWPTNDPYREILYLAPSKQVQATLSGVIA